MVPAILVLTGIIAVAVLSYPTRDLYRKYRASTRQRSWSVVIPD